MPRVGVITGTRREADCLRHPPDRQSQEIACSGADAARAHAQAASLLEGGCVALLSFGVAGGLDPALASGTLLVPDSVILPDGGILETDRAWRDRLRVSLRSAGIEFVTGRVMGVDRPIADSGPKRLLFEGTGARAADMESHAVLQAAHRAGVPAIVVRAVADTAHDALPALALQAVGSDGEIRYIGIAAVLLRQPAEIGALVRLARLSRPAFASLRRVAALPSLRGPF